MSILVTCLIAVTKKIPDQSNLKKEGFILAGSSRMHHGVDGRVTPSRWVFLTQLENPPQVCQQGLLPRSLSILSDEQYGAPPCCHERKRQCVLPHSCADSKQVAVRANFMSA